MSICKHYGEEFKMICPLCGKEFVVRGSQNDFNKGRLKKYCSRSCANTRHHSEETKNKIKETIINKGNSKTYKCKVCGKEYKFIKGVSTKKVCSRECLFYIRKHRKDYLSPDAIKNMSMGGRKSVKLQGDNRRSGNEIYFYELCKNKFNNISHNEPIFNGWDADIIIYDYKIAVLWNGIWHYKKITKNHSLAQVQNRDNIKIREIINTGYFPYIIKDMNKQNKSFVENEFEKLLKFINYKYNT